MNLFERLTLESGVLAYYRVDEHNKILVIANTKKEPFVYDLKKDQYFKDAATTRLLLKANNAQLDSANQSLTLDVGAAAIIKLA